MHFFHGSRLLHWSAPLTSQERNEEQQTWEQSDGVHEHKLLFEHGAHEENEITWIELDSYLFSKSICPLRPSSKFTLYRHITL